MKFVYLKNIHKYIQLNNRDMMVMFKIQSAVLVLTYPCSSVGSDDLQFFQYSSFLWFRAHLFSTHSCLHVHKK